MSSHRAGHTWNVYPGSDFSDTEHKNQTMQPWKNLISKVSQSISGSQLAINIKILEILNNFDSAVPPLALCPKVIIADI